MSLRIEDIKKDTTFYEFCCGHGARFIATCDGHKYTDENKNDYWRVYGKNIDTGEVVEFFHLEGHSNYPKLYDYVAYSCPKSLEWEDELSEKVKQSSKEGCC